MYVWVHARMHLKVIVTSGDFSWDMKDIQRKGPIQPGFVSFPSYSKEVSQPSSCQGQSWFSFWDQAYLGYPGQSDWGIFVLARLLVLKPEWKANCDSIGAWEAQSLLSKHFCTLYLLKIGFPSGPRTGSGKSWHAQQDESSWTPSKTEESSYAFHFIAGNGSHFISFIEFLAGFFCEWAQY